MRQFVVVGHDAPTNPDFPLDDLAGAGGRLDLLCRCVGAALFTSHGLRDDACVHLVLQDEVTVSFDGAAIRGLHPGERAVAGQVRAALDETEAAIGHREVEVSPGLTVSSRGLEPVLEAADRDGTICQLHEDGDPAGEAEPPDEPVFVLSDHRDFRAEEVSLLSETADRRLSLGPTAVHADHAIAVAHNYCDTDGYRRY